jgi:thioredoxin reductase
MHLLQAGVDMAVIALWLGHESIETTHVYLAADLATKERALDKLAPVAEQGARFILTDARMQTSVPGLFAVEDIRAQPVRQITNATADGTVAAVMAHKYLEDRQLLVGGAGAGRGDGV